MKLSEFESACVSQYMREQKQALDAADPDKQDEGAERDCAPPGCLIFSLAALRRAKKIPPWAVWGWYISIKLSTTAEMPGKGVKGETRAAGTA